MGSMIHLALGRLELDWGKNNGFTDHYGEGGEDFGKFFRREIAPRLKLMELVGEGYQDFDLSYAMENLTPYSVMQLLIENSRAQKLNVNWQFNDVAENGWAERSDFVRPLAASNRFLIVTEGSSDANIIHHGFKLLRPHIADFFDFVDMEEGYPFTGTGNVFRFVQGLISISIQNNVIVLYDNDAEGVSSFQRTLELNIPENMRVVRLPDLPIFSRIRTKGPNGDAVADINGRAASIECYLDLGNSPSVRWTSYNSKIEAYQGELTNKERYARQFLKQRTKVSTYNYAGLEAVLDMIVHTCSAMKEQERLAELEKI